VADVCYSYKDKQAREEARKRAEQRRAEQERAKKDDRRAPEKDRELVRA
jgi:hypothetical protein